jgi:small subunit ribosomal protein S4
MGVKLFLKGDKCLSPKCPMVIKPYPPGQKSKRRTPQLSEYGKELKEKQKLKNWYNLGERQFRNYIKEILNKRGKVEDAVSLLIQNLESRFDNVVFRLGFASSHVQARQLINHGHFMINGKSVNIPSYKVKIGDVITLHPSSSKNKYFVDKSAGLKKNQAPSWLNIDADKREGKVTGKPSLEEVAPPADILSIFEFYSR